MLKLPIKLPGKKAFAIDTSKDLSMPSLHMLSIAAGTRGSGKSVAVSSLIAHARERDFLDRVLLISPTYPSNREIWNVAGIKEEDVYEPTKTVVETIKTFIKQEKDEWDEFLEQKKKWDRYQNLISSPNLNMRSTKTLEELMLYSQMGFSTRNQSGNTQTVRSLIVRGYYASSMMRWGQSSCKEAEVSLV